MVPDMKKLVKIIRKAKEGDVTSTFKRIARLDDLKIIAMSDASFRSMDGKVRLVEGSVIFLSDGINTSLLDWKARKISQLCKSTFRLTDNIFNFQLTDRQTDRQTKSCRHKYTQTGRQIGEEDTQIYRLTHGKTNK